MASSRARTSVSASSAGAACWKARARAMAASAAGSLMSLELLLRVPAGRRAVNVRVRGIYRHAGRPTVEFAPMRRLLCLVSIGLLAAGCGGGGSKELSATQYQQKVNDVLVKTHDRFQLDPGASLKELVPQLEAGATAYGEAVEQLRDLEPPAELQTLEHQLLAALAGVRTQLRASAADARGGRTQEMPGHLTKLATAENRLTTLLHRMDRAAA